MSKLGNYQITRKERQAIDNRRKLREGPWWFWLSYGTPLEGFLGAVVIEAPTLFDAALEACRYSYWNAPKVNPMGVVLDSETLKITPDSFRNRWLTQADLNELRALGHRFQSEADVAQKQEALNKQKSDPLLQKAIKASQAASNSSLSIL